jgi:hypothetical protein
VNDVTEFARLMEIRRTIGYVVSSARDVAQIIRTKSQHPTSMVLNNSAS